MMNRKIIFIIIFCISLSYLSVVEYYKVSYHIFDSWEEWHLKHMTNEMGAPLQYRIISYLIPEVIIKITHIDTWKAYLFERFIFLFLTGFFFYFYSLKLTKNNELLSILYVVIFFYLYNLTSYSHFQPAEEINTFIFLLAFYFIYSRKFYWFLVIVCVGAFNKSTVVFLIPTYFFYEILIEKKIDLKLIGKTFLVTLLFFEIYFGIRMVLGRRAYFCEFWQYKNNITHLINRNILYYNFLFPSIIPFILIIISWNRQPVIIKALAPTIILFTLGHFLISILLEFRTFMPLSLLTIPSFGFFAEKYIKSDLTVIKH